MINQKIFTAILLSIYTSITVFSQEGLSVWGGFQTNGNLFLRDSLIGAYNIPQYDKQIFGSDSWINLNMSYSGFNLALRYDIFNNSNLLNPNSSYTAHGLGRWLLSKEIEKLEISAGYIYDQIGSGIIFRSFEERAQLLDNALLGFSLKYNIHNDWSIKAFGGKQKNLFSTYNSFIKGINLNGFYKKSDSSSWSIAPGLGFVNRTFGDEIVNHLAQISGSYLPVDQFVPSYNTNAATFYNTFYYKKFSWYLETSIKLDDIYYDPNALRTLANNKTNLGKFRKGSGHVYYTSFGFSGNKLGITAEAKRTDGFDFRAEPNLALNRGLVSYIPPMARVNTYRLTAYYTPATQFLSEGAFQIDIKYGLNDHWTFAINYSDIKDKDFKKQFYREIHAEVFYKEPDQYQLTFGIQRQEFNQELYFGKGGEPTVKTFTPFAEFLYDFSSTHSLRIETQYMFNKQDIGSWIYFLAEYGISPHWLFEISDMYNTVPHKGKSLNYPTAGIVYTSGNNRYGLRFVKQVQGIVCSGGICRLEPAFSGLRASITSNF
ncbi:MAG: hypothetical protein IT267_01880 [Saprospiraceae bacterium]|nr:hypothetical protein [Saprospiraceae bacterium]